MSGDEDPLPGGEVSEDIAFFAGDFLFEGVNFAGDIDLSVLGVGEEFVEIFLEFAQRFFEFEDIQRVFRFSSEHWINEAIFGFLGNKIIIF
jgi:hypothetical protein